MGDLALVIFAVACALALTWLCAKIRNIEQCLTVLHNDNDKAAGLAAEAARVAQHTSTQVDVAAELGHQSAAGDRAVAHDLADSAERADNEASGEPGAAADAGLRSDPAGK